MLLEQERRDLCLTARALATAPGVAPGESATLSVRSGDLVVVTPHGVPLDQIQAADCPVMSLDDRMMEGRRDPAAETTLHMAVHRQAADHGREVTAVVNAFTADTVAVSSVLAELPPIHHRAAGLGGAVAVTPYTTYGTGDIADQAVKALKGRDAALLSNHGGMALGRGLEHALENLRLLDWLCATYLRARQLGEPRVLSEDELAAISHRDTYGWAGPDIW
ncbi:class II aldolase/adducin family protein [Nocardiopsis lambiniae]|uniref:Class II aldolase/adducin family protein n=1 Tax=Nocardiopsis lambiniae TaxID=3075539 RepID=A0ABU2M5U7_9ACTN|nr:class II aldolase/adducin family protein [Nocardiopsis sp. DSM 44743]MDT0328012.1 class II aldolase/adducin family protein [Nocardiopsis sp. DSM 44743]